MLIAWIGLQPLAAADDSDSAVVIVRAPGDEVIISRLRAELSSYRFRAIELADKPARRTESLSQLALQRDAQAALRAKPDAMAVELWVRAPSGAAPASEELVNAGPGRDPEVLALRVTEAMRARGLALPPLSAATSKPAAASGGRGTTLPAQEGEVGVAEPHTLQPGELTEPVAKPPEATKPAVTPAKPASPGGPSKPAEGAQTPARAEAAVPKAATPASPSKPAEGAQTTREGEAATTPDDKPRTFRKREEKEPETPPEALASSVAGAREALLYVEVGPAGVLSPGPGRLGPALDLLVSFTFRPYQTSSISLVGLIPLLNTDLVGNGASIDVQTWGIGGFGDLHFQMGRMELSAGLGGLALISTVLVTPEQGQEQALFRSEYNTQRLAALLGRVGASVALTRELHVSASIMAGLTVEQLRLRFPPGSGEDMRSSAPDARWGWPLLLGSVSLELALPWDR